MSNAANKPKRAILHIGTEKTGTTSLQECLALSRKSLRSHGVLYPQSAGPKNHTRLVASSLDDGVVDNIKAHFMAARGEDETKLRTSFAEDLAHEMGEGPDWHTLLLSSELIHSRLHTQTEIDRLFSYFSAYVDEIHVVLVLRQQDKLAVSRFSTVIRAGHRGTDDIFDDLHEHAYVSVPVNRYISDFEHYYDYARLIERFAGYVPAEKFHIWLYEDGGIKLDAVARFEAMLDVKLTPGSKGVVLNNAMSLTAQYIIARLNAEFPTRLASGRRNETFVALKNQIAVEVTGPPRKVNEADAKAFMERFTHSNAAVASRLHRRQLFEPAAGNQLHVGRNVLPPDFDALLEHYRKLLQKKMRSTLYSHIKSFLKPR